MYQLRFSALAALSLGVSSALPIGSDGQVQDGPSSVDAREHRLKDSDFHVDYTVVPFTGLTITGAQVNDIKSGCGSDNNECVCTTNTNGDLVMTGHGTSGTATGLDFKCKFNVNSSPCTIHVDIPYVGDNSLSCTCSGYEFYGCTINSSGHNFNQQIAVGPA